MYIKGTWFLHVTTKKCATGKRWRNYSKEFKRNNKIASINKDTWTLYLLDIKVALVFIVEFEVAIFREDWLLVLLQAEPPALIDDCTK